MMSGLRAKLTRVTRFVHSGRIETLVPWFATFVWILSQPLKARRISARWIWFMGTRLTTTGWGTLPKAACQCQSLVVFGTAFSYPFS
jgi:hypothetical protein